MANQTKTKQQQQEQKNKLLKYRRRSETSLLQRPSHAPESHSQSPVSHLLCILQESSRCIPG